MEMSPAVPMTAWQSGRFRAARAGSRKLLFGCMYEDAEIELGAFQPDGRIFCIASAGCTAMRLAVQSLRWWRLTSIPSSLPTCRSVSAAARHSARQRRTHSSIVRAPRASRRVAPTKGTNIPRSGRSRRSKSSYWRRHLDTRRFRAAFSFLFSRVVSSVGLLRRIS